MGNKALKYFNFSILCFVVSSFGSPADALASKSTAPLEEQTFQATENDGTATVIHGGTKADDTDAGPITSAPAEKTVVAPVAPTAGSDLSDIKKQNSELMRRLEALEKERAAVQANAAVAQPAPSPTPAPVAAVVPVAPTPVTTPTSPPAPVAPVAAAAPVVAVAPVVSAKPTAPVATNIDPLEARMIEKARLTQEARDQTARQDALESRKTALRQASQKFDDVPDRFIPELSERLKYANDILKRWGRAYDYRVTTLGDFKKILAELESADEKKILSN